YWVVTETGGNGAPLRAGRGRGYQTAAKPEKTPASRRFGLVGRRRAARRRHARGAAQRLIENEFDLPVDAAELVLRPALQRVVELGTQTQENRFALRHGPSRLRGAASEPWARTAARARRRRPTLSGAAFRCSRPARRRGRRREPP